MSAVVSKQVLIEEAAIALNAMGIGFTHGVETDIAMDCEFLDASFGSGNKKISYQGAVLFDEGRQEIFMWEMTKETGSGFSFGGDSESSFQVGKTLFKRVKSIQYGSDGKAYEVDLDLGAIPKVFKDLAKKYNWKFHTVVNKHKALYGQNHVNDVNPVNPINHVNDGNGGERLAPVGALGGTGAAGHVKPPGHPLAKVIFWLGFGALALLDLVFIIGDSGLVFTVGSLLVLGLLGLKHKVFCSSALKGLLGIVIGLVVTVIIFVVSVAVMDPGEAKSSVNAEGVGFARTVDETTLEPVEKTDNFFQTDTVIYYSVMCHKIPKGAELVTNWYYNGELALQVEPERFAEGLDNRYYTASLLKGENPFPVGDYKVELVFSLEGNVIFTATDTCTVSGVDGGAATTEASTQAETQGLSQNASNVLFEDDFARADSDVVGSNWQEVKMRNGTGTSVPTIVDGDSPWRVSGGVLKYEGIGDGTYTEDYIQTLEAFPIEKTLIEFELKGVASTQLGYVGPGAFWAPEAGGRLGGFSVTDPNKGLIGVQAFYGWETGGTSGFVYKLGGAHVATNDTFGGVNQGDFVKHALWVEGGNLYYRVGDGQPVITALTQVPEAGAMRHFSFDVRYYDSGVPFSVEIRNFRVTKLE